MITVWEVGQLDSTSTGKLEPVSTRGWLTLCFIESHHAVGSSRVCRWSGPAGSRHGRLASGLVYL